MLQMDLMSRPTSIIKENVWQYYEKLPNFRAKCRFCQRTISYIYYHLFKHHLHTFHQENFISIANKNLIETPERYFNHSASKCLICNKNVHLQNFYNHILLHSADHIKNYEIDKKSREYYIQYDDFNAECNFCSTVLRLSLTKPLNNHMRSFHIERLRNTQETYDIIGSLDRGLMLQRDLMSRSATITNRNVWQYYEKLPNFKAKCRFCSRIISYIYYYSFKNHLYTFHQENFISIANKNLIETPERYFNHSTSKCLICNINVQLQNFHNHILLHSADQIKKYEIDDRSREYCIQYNDFNAKCNFCSSVLCSSITMPLTSHTRNCHVEQLRNTQETYDTICPSKRDLSLERDATSIPTNIANESELWQNYVKLSNFQAKCKSCDFQDCYINVTNFSQHVKESHEEVFSYEDRDGEGWPVMYFKYYVQYKSLCLLCQGLHGAVVVANYSNLLELHLENWHFLNKRLLFTIDYFHYDRNSWVWKYCEQSGDYKIKCDICHTEVLLDVELSHLNYHVNTGHLNNANISKIREERMTMLDRQESSKEQIEGKK